MKNNPDKRFKNLLIAVAMLVILIIGGVGAYFTATDELTNKFTVGNVSIEIVEPEFLALTDSDEDGVSDQPMAVAPNMQVKKDPYVENTSESNSAFVFLRVTVPKKKIFTSDVEQGTVSEEATVTQLFQLNDLNNTDKANGIEWVGVDTFNKSDWYLVSTDSSNADCNIYIFAYGTSVECTALEAGATTTKPLFNSVTFCNAVNASDFAEMEPEIKVEAFAIQATDLTSTDKTEPKAVWAILKAQNQADE